MIRVCLTQIFDKRKNSTSRVFQELLGTLYLKKTLHLKFLALLLTQLNSIFQPYKNRTYKNHLTILTKHLILDAAASLDPPLILIANQMTYGFCEY